MTADWETEIKPILGATDFCKTDINGVKRCGSGAFLEKPTWGAVFKGGPTWTGIILTTCFLIAYPLCSEWFRKKVLKCIRSCFPTEQKKEGTFNVFWYAHHLFLVYLIVLCFHGAWAWLRKPSAYMYVCPFLAIYCVERMVRGHHLRWKLRGEP